MRIVKHLAMLDMTGDSRHFKTAAELEADGWQRVYYPGCDYHTPDDTDGVAHPGVSVRPKDGSRGIGTWCDDCREEYTASFMGDYPPPTDCGCRYHNIYRIDADGQPSCYGKRASKPVHSSTRYEPGDERPDYGARFAEVMNQ